MSDNLGPAAFPRELIRQELLHLLHWNVLGPLNDIQVAEISSEGDVVTLHPFFGHPIAAMPIAEPAHAVLRVTVGIVDCEEKHEGEDIVHGDEIDEEAQHKPPNPLVIDKKGTSPITIQDFVVSVHEYLNANKHKIIEAKDEQYSASYSEKSRGNIPAETQFYFEAIQYTYDEQEKVILGDVTIFAEGYLGQTLDQFWSKIHAWHIEYAKDRENFNSPAKQLSEYGS